MDTKESVYEQCVAMMRDLIRLWEELRPEEELVIAVLPKYDSAEREKRIEYIYHAMLKEEYE